MKKQEIILSMQMAFLGAICNKVRLIAFDMTDKYTFTKLNRKS